MRRAIAALCAGGAIAIVAVDFGVVSPYALSHQPGPANPSFGWYVTYHLIPVVSIAFILLLLLGAWRFWRRTR